MHRLLAIIISFTITTCLYAQTVSGLHTKSFYYDVDHFSLTSESMKVLREFTEEIKKYPIEIIEIIGYVESGGAPVYNQIRSKKRMNSIKGTIDTAMIIHQYTPTNLEYPPSFLYSYEDGYNWRRVDITYKYRDPSAIPPVNETKINDNQNTISNQKTPEQIALENAQNTTNNTNQKTPEQIALEKAQNATNNTNQKTPEQIALENAQKTTNNTNQKTPEQIALENAQNATNNSNPNPPADTTQNKTITTKPKTPEELVIERLRNKVNKTPEEIARLEELEEKQQLRIEGKSQAEIDKIVIRERTSSKKSTAPKNFGQRLSEIDVKTLDKSVVLVVMNIQFEGDKPIMTAEATKEMNDLIKFMDTNKQVNAFIRGHVCCGDEMKLSRKRAKHVYTQLIKNGIDEERLRYEGFSNSLLLVSPERNEADRARNRRVDIIFSVKPTPPVVTTTTVVTPTTTQEQK